VSGLDSYTTTELKVEIDRRSMQRNNGRDAPGQDTPRPSADVAQDHWFAAMVERAEAAEAREAKLREALKEIAEERFGEISDGSTPRDFALSVLAASDTPGHVETRAGEGVTNYFKEDA
jgi:hypothetical protein